MCSAGAVRAGAPSDANIKVIDEGRKTNEMLAAADDGKQVAEMPCAIFHTLTKGMRKR